MKYVVSVVISGCRRDSCPTKRDRQPLRAKSKSSGFVATAEAMPTDYRQHTMTLARNGKGARNEKKRRIMGNADVP